jgi:hypothetical protein
MDARRVVAVAVALLVAALTLADWRLVGGPLVRGSGAGVPAPGANPRSVGPPQRGAASDATAAAAGRAAEAQPSPMSSAADDYGEASAAADTDADAAATAPASSPAGTPSQSPVPSPSGTPAVTPPPSPSLSPSRPPAVSRLPHPVPAPRSRVDAARPNPYAGTALWVRAHVGVEAMLHDVLLKGVRAYWPPHRFGRLYIVLDAGVPADEALGARLVAVYGGAVLRRATGIAGDGANGADGGGGWYIASSAPAPAVALPLRTADDPARDWEAAVRDGIGGGSSGGGSSPFLSQPLVHVVYADRAPIARYPFGDKGYHVQQYHTLTADAFVPVTYPGAHPDEVDNAVIGVVDADALVTTLPHDGTYFDGRGRPRVIPRVGLPIGDLWSQSAVATEFFLGVPEPFRGMSYFPVYIYRRHLVALRAHVAARHNATFEAAFAAMAARGYYSQFNIMTAYLFHFHKADYAWHYFLPHQDSGKPLDRDVLLSHNVSGVTRDFSYLGDPHPDDPARSATEPYPRTWQHWKHHRRQRPADDHLASGFCRGVTTSAARAAQRAAAAAAGAPPRAVGTNRTTTTNNATLPPPPLPAFATLPPAHGLCGPAGVGPGWTEPLWGGLTSEPDLWDWEYAAPDLRSVQGIQGDYYDAVAAELAATSAPVDPVVGPAAAGGGGRVWDADALGHYIWDARWSRARGQPTPPWVTVPAAAAKARADAEAAAAAAATAAAA